VKARCKIALILAIWLMGSSKTPAGPTVPITLEEAKSRALKSNLTLSQSRRDEQAARWKMLWAVSEVLPHVSLNSSYSRLDEESVARSNIMRDVILQEYGQYINPEDFPPFAFENLYSTSVSVDQPIYNGGMEIVGLRIAATTKRQIRFARAAQERQVLLEVESAYYDLCRAQAALDVHEKMIDVSQGYAERIRRRADLGLAAPVDVMRWELQSSTDEAVLVEARSAFELAQLALARSLGDDAGTAYVPADLNGLTADSIPSSQVAQLDFLWSNLRRFSPDLQIMQANVDLAKHGLGTSLSNFQPKLNFNYTYSWQADDDIRLDGFESWVASVSLSLPIFASFGNFAKYQESRINVKKALEAERDYEAGLYIQLAAARNSLLTALERLKSAQKMTQQAREVLRIQENRSELGLITNLELLDAQSANRQAELALINARFDALIAAAQVKRWTGE
jgi:outer membrane protein TolC